MLQLCRVLPTNLLPSLSDFACAQNVDCKVFTSFWHYVLMANYCWILMEGLYLHNLVFLAFFTDSSSILRYVGLGWGACHSTQFHLCNRLLNLIAQKARDMIQKMLYFFPSGLPVIFIVPWVVVRATLDDTL
ncbi:hypothetical protein HPB50_026634 [Hyalomma asiaticum]|uniref:Uncharacterized protein n=1 Tax=Hyalomma asiaticum TaxID=266040 RepID=A0ACB7SYI6_HYAAI|nr:hypothetical protein HPB50_026634 [Hyalomma asiaticum]